ncbi:amidohydrolase family protein [Sinorhizobium fredii]|uniref:Amidohydrolase 2 family protein n=1 Tax=Rhizobium fredii TaxID=380 RepID=A0A2L0HCV1_RHIFR|nr:amidohydrolase family protein [Sinorhizobium fredii]AUX79321.1 amidohydrolase 2 family protein [Sinorhizobium fredii]
MHTELEQFIASSTLCDTHEHTECERFYRDSRHDVLTHLFDNYVVFDLHSAGASQQSLDALINPGDPDVARRFRDIQPYWDKIHFTGYAEGVKLAAKRLFGIDALTPEALAAAQESCGFKGNDNERLTLLKDIANLDHVQIDTNTRPFPPEMLGQDFFLYDLNMFDFCAGRPDFDLLERQLGKDVTSLKDLGAAIEVLFDISARYAVAVKSQHAYVRTLKWTPRSASDAAISFDAVRRLGTAAAEADRLCLGDWCMSRVAQMCARHDLPFKMHTGYFTKNNFMPTDNLRAGNMDLFLKMHPDTRFVLMHIAYPHSDELIALAKHYTNVSIDMCWAWSINPLHASDFVRRYLHAAPKNKLFVFGGDTLLPTSSVGYAMQFRKWFGKTLGREVDDGSLSEAEAIRLAEFFMMANPYDYYDLTGKKEVLRTGDAESVTKLGHQGAFSAPPKSIRDSGRA